MRVSDRSQHRVLLPLIAAMVVHMLATQASQAAEAEAVVDLPDRCGEVLWAVAISPDGKLVASGGGGTFRQVGPDIIDVAWGAGHDFEVRLWDVAKRQPIQNLHGHTAAVAAVSWSPDGKQLLSGSSDGTLRLWEPGTGREIRQWVGHDGAMVAAAAFSPDGKKIVSGGRDGTVRVWDAATGAELRRINWIARRVWDVSWSPEGSKLVVCGDHPEVKVFDANSGQALLALTGHTDSAVRAIFSPDGGWIATGAWDNSAKVWDAKTGKELRSLAHPSRVEGLAFTAEGKRLLTGSLDQRVRLWDAVAGKELVQLQGHTAPVSRVSIQGRIAASGSWDGTVHLWRLAGQVNLAQAWQVLPEAYHPPEKFVAAVQRLVRELDDDQPAQREAASLTLKELGPPAVPLLLRLKPEDLSPEQQRRVASLLRGQRPLTNAEVEKSRADPRYLLDCLEEEDAAVRAAAFARLRPLLKGDTRFDPDARPEARAAAIAELRKVVEATRPR